MKKSKITGWVNFWWKISFNRDTINIGLVFIMSFLIASISYSIMIKPFEPEAFADKCISYLANKEYDKAAECYINVPAPIKDKPLDVIRALEEKYDGTVGINIREVKRYPGSNMCIMELEIMQGRDCFSDSLLLYDVEDNPFTIDREWKAEFPFKTRDVVITGVEGSRVFIDGIENGRIKDGSLVVNNILCCSHVFKAGLDGVGESDEETYEVNERNGSINLEMEISRSFKESMERLISDFCSSWSSYCLNEDPSCMKPYLTDSLYGEYTSNSDMFNESKYELCQGNVAFNELTINKDGSIFFNVDEKWHLKEVTTARDIVFKDNNKYELEQMQNITWKYYIIEDAGSWKISSAEQISFKQEILNKDGGL